MQREQQIFCLKHVYSYLILGVVFIFLIVTSCTQKDDCQERVSYDSNDLNKDINLEELYEHISQEALDGMYQSWQKLTLQSESTEIVEELEFVGKRRLVIVRHSLEGQNHFGVIIYPKDYQLMKEYPALVWAQGLNQNDPSLDLFGWSGLTTFFSRLDDYFILVPSFRGQTLKVESLKYCSDGFFGDAFDGATTDALRLLKTAKEMVPNVDQHRIALAGASRGGTVALLAGARDTSINAVISISGPVDFFSREVHDRYGKQYKYQFLSQTRDIDDIRKRMIMSSPIYFSHYIKGSLLIIHGKKDHLVPLYTVERFIEQLKDKDRLDVAFVDNGHAFDEMERVYRWLRQNN